MGHRPSIIADIWHDDAGSWLEMRIDGENSLFGPFANGTGAKNASDEISRIVRYQAGDNPA